jgi:hypothetical protein
MTKNTYKTGDTVKLTDTDEIGEVATIINIASDSYELEFEDGECGWYDHNEFELHHTALTRRYISRKTDGLVSAYKGRFGQGYTLEHPNWDSNRYSFISYYIQK